MSVVTETFTGDGNSSVVTWRGGVGEFQAQGDFGTGTAKLQWRMDSNEDWVDVSGASLTSDGRSSFDIGPSELRVNLSGSSSPDLKIRIAGRSTLYG